MEDARMGIWELNVGGARPVRTAALVREGASKLQFRRDARAVSLGFWKNLKSAFLPEGYPNSVTADYLPFQTWDTLQGLSTYVRSMLSTQALLGGIGVGATKATVVGATFQWFLRDFTGMLGGILFTLYQGSNFDSSAKQWRLAADLLNDMGMLMDLISPLFPGAFITILCIGSIARAITGTASGATRAALTQHFAIRQNAADVQAKEGSQETAATMVGMLLGMVVARATAGDAVMIWFCFLVLTAFHMYADRFTDIVCKELSDKGFPRSQLQGRSESLFDQPESRQNSNTVTIVPQAGDSDRYKTLSGLEMSNHDLEPLSSATLLECAAPTPKEMSVKERVLPQLPIQPLLDLWKPDRRWRISFGSRISSIQPREGWESFAQALTQQYGKQAYTVTVEGRIIHIILKRRATLQDCLRGYVHALRLNGILEASHRFGNSISAAAERDCLAWMEFSYGAFLDSMRASGWVVSRVHISASEWRADWPEEPAPGGNLDFSSDPDWSAQRPADLKAD